VQYLTYLCVQWLRNLVKIKNYLKMKRIFTYAAILFAISTVMTSCSKNSDTGYYANALVTVKTAGDGTCYLQLDNNTTVLPLNLPTSPFGSKQVRAMTHLEDIQSMVGEYNKSANVTWIDSVLTKKPVLPKDTGKSGYGYGDHPIEILNSWTTVLEDNYLTLCFSAPSGYYSTMHYVNLVYGINPEDPYEVMFTHDMEAPADYYSGSFTGLVAFDLTQIPGLAQETSAIVTVRYISPVGERTVHFAYPGDPVSNSGYAQNGGFPEISVSQYE